MKVLLCVRQNFLGAIHKFFGVRGNPQVEFSKGPFIKVVHKWIHGGPLYGPCWVCSKNPM